MGAYNTEEITILFLTRIDGMLVNILEKVITIMKYYHLVIIQIRHGELYKSAG